MADELFESGGSSDADVQRVRVEALGEPGQRRFRLMVVINGETHIVWMEKQQLQALGMAIEQLLEQVPDTDVPILDNDDSGDFDQDTLNQFRVGRIELGYDAANQRVVIGAFDLQQADEDESASRHVERDPSEIR